MNKYELTTQKKKVAIIQSALSLFKDRGFSDVTIKEIATHAGVSQASIYNYFGSKVALVAECTNFIMEDVFRQATTILESDLGFLEKLESALSICAEKLNLSISEHFTKEALEDEALSALLVENINRGKAVIYRLYIELGKNEKAIDNSIPTDIYLQFIDAINYMGSKPAFYEDLDNNMRYIHKLVFYGIIGK